MGRSESFRRLKSDEMDIGNGHSLIPGLPRDVALQCLAKVPMTSLWGVCTDWQTLVNESEDFEFARSKEQNCEVNWLYTLVHTKEGLFCWNAYDPLSEKWHALPALPENVKFELTSPGSIGLSHAVQCVSTKNKLVMLAGLKSSTGSGPGHNWSQLEPALNHPWVFEPRTRQWKKGQAFSTSRKWCACGVADGKVYVASGCGLQWDMTLSKKTEVYDPASDSWSSLPNLESSKFSGEAITAVNVKGDLHMVSGKGVFIKEGAVFRPSAQKWSKMRPGLKNGWNGSCVSVDNRFYVIDDTLGKLSTYNSESDTWSTLLEHPLLKDLINVVATSGKIVGLVNPAGSNAEIEGSSLRIIDITSDPPTIHVLPVPQGRLVSIQILARMSLH